MPPSDPPAPRGLSETTVRPIAPGNGSASPPPWDLDRSGGLYFFRAVFLGPVVTTRPVGVSFSICLLLQRHRRRVPNGSSFGSWRLSLSGGSFMPWAPGRSITMLGGR